MAAVTGPTKPLKPFHGEGRKAPLAGMAEQGAKTRYQYAAPTIKKQFGRTPALGIDVAEYDLPVIDVQTEMRNFPGYAEAQVYTLEDMQDGDISGVTDTDVDTHVMAGKNTGGGYTKIYQKSNPMKSKWPTKRS